MNTTHVDIDRRYVMTDHSGYSLRLDLSKFEHDVLINVLKRESYNPTVKAIYEAVKEAKELARRREDSFGING